LSLAKTVKGLSAMSAPETSSVLNQYGIGCHVLLRNRLDGGADPLFLPGRDGEPHVELDAVVSTALE
jgi:hypothetical protein